MKQLIMISSLLCLGIIDAQVPQGTQFISGQINFSTTKNYSNNSSTTSYKVLPTYGYFFAPNWVIVLSTGYKQEIDKLQYRNTTFDLLNTENKTSAFVITPSLRKFWILDARFSLFAQLDFPLEFGNVTQTTRLENESIEVSHNKNAFSSYGISLKPGIDYFLAPQWKIAANVGEIGYFNTHYKNSNLNKKRFNFEGNLSSIQFAVKYIIPTSQKTN